MKRHFESSRRVALCFIFLLVGCSESERHDKAASGTQKMVERLASLANNVDPKSDPYANEARVQMLRELPRPSDLRGRVRLDFQLATELLCAGRNQEAVELYGAVLTQITGPYHRIFPDDLIRKVRAMLALASLRLGEEQNCVLRHSSQSCILPIEGDGIHELREGSQMAIRELEILLEEKPDDMVSRWLLNVAYMTLGDYPAGVPERWLIPPSAFKSDYDIGRFADIAHHLGIDVTGLSGGCVVDDFDGDGYLDIMASSWGLQDQLRYFRNNGDGTFTDMTEQAGVLGITGGLNLVHGDYNNDGFPDVFVLRGAWRFEGGNHPNSLLRNNGDGTFADVTEEAGVLSFHPTQTAAWADFDNDGWLDLFIGNESFGNTLHPCELYRNNGDGTFTEMAAAAGLAVTGFVKAVVWGDYNNDGYPDLYLSRLYEPNLLFRNDSKGALGPGAFTDVGATAGVTEPINSFPAWFWDYDNDGWLDIFVSGYKFVYDAGASQAAAEVAADYLGMPFSAEPPRLYRNKGNGTFEDVTQAVGLHTVLYTMGSNFGDLDNDGWLDFYAGTGDPDFSSIVPNRMFRNNGGRAFQDVTTAGGFGHLQKGHGVAFADLDNDGDQDIYIVMGGAFAGDVYQNLLFENPGHGNNWIVLKLVGTTSNRSAIGARIRITVDDGGAPRNIFSTVSSGGSFGATSFRQEIGLGRANTISQLEIQWPGNRSSQLFDNVAVNQIIEIHEGDSAIKMQPVRPFRFQLHH